MIRFPFRVTLLAAASLGVAAQAADLATPPPATADTPAKPARAHIVGKVTDAAGKPVEGAVVFVDTAWPKVGLGVLCPSCYADCAKQTTSGPGGDFRLDDLDPALGFNLLIAAKGFAPTTVTVRNPGAKTVVATLAARAGGETADKRATGRILDPQGHPVHGATVERISIWRNNSSTSSDRSVESVAVSDADGRFALFGTQSFDNLRVRIRARGCAPRTETLPPGDTPQEIRLQEGTTVTGRLVRDGLPVAGAQVGLIQKDRWVKTFVGEQRAATDKDGRFTFYSMPPNQEWRLYGISDSLKGLGAVAPRGICTPANEGTLAVGDIALIPGHVVAGRVRLTDGKPVPPHTRLMLTRDDAWDQVIVELDAEGRFRLEHAPAGVVKLSVGLEDYRPSAANASLEDSISIRGDLTADKTDLVLEYEPGKFGSNWKPVSERPLAGAEAAFDRPPPLPGKGAMQAARDAAALRERQRQEHLKKRAATPSRFSGVATQDAEGKMPISGAKVTVVAAYSKKPDEGLDQLSDSPWVGQVRVTDASGAFDFGELDPELSLVAEVSAPGRITTTTQSGFGRVVLKARTPSNTPPLRGVIVDAAGAPVSNARVMLRTTDRSSVTEYARESEASRAESDDAGRFTLEDIGSCDRASIEVRAPGFAPMVAARLAPGATENTVKLGRGGRIAGRLVKEGKPLAGITVVSEEVSKSSATHLDSVCAVTDADGRFVFEHLPVDRELAVYAAANSVAAHGVHQAIRLNPLGEGDSRDLGELAVTRGVTLAGRVYLKDGKVDENLSVSIGPLDLWAAQKVPCDPAGRFSAQVPPGPVRVQVNTYYHHLTLRNRGRGTNYPNAVEGRLDADKTDLLIELAPGREPSPDELTLGPLRGAERASDASRE